MTQVTMRRIRVGEVPFDGGTAIQERVDRPVFSGNGPCDYVCVECGNVLAAGMDPAHMTKRVRVRCGRCRTVNVAVTDEAAAVKRVLSDDLGLLDRSSGKGDSRRHKQDCACPGPEGGER
jgi:phage FluMu protein Com